MTRAPLRGLPLAECTLPALLDRQAAVYEELPLLRVGDVRWSYREVRDAAARAAGTLAAHGVRPGDRVAFLTSNRVEMLEFILGCAWLGAVSVPINVALRGPGLEHVLTDCGARLLIADSVLLEFVGGVGRPAEVWVVEDMSPDRAEPLDVPRCGPEETMSILYTSGTTGPAKGVCCPHAQSYWWGVNVAETLGIRESDVLYTCLPLFHTNALNAFAQALVSGAEYVLGTRFSASRFFAELEETGATVTYLLGAMVSILCGRPPDEHDRRHRARVALAPATPAPLQRPFTERFGIALVDGFGSTETNMTIGVPADRQRPGYMGTVIDGFDADVVDELDVPVPDGSAGELVLRSRQPFAFATGYHNRPEATVRQWRNLWFHTGDRVVREPDGWFRYLDRMNDAIRRRGENISSFEVEQVVGLHPDVQTVAAYAVPSELGEDDVMVSVVRKPGAELTAADLAGFCRPRLARFAVPRYIDFTDDLPLTASGKVRKAALRQRGVTPTSWDREKGQ